MSDTVETVGGGTLSQVTHDDLTVVSNNETADEMRENFDAEPKALDGEPEDPKEAEKKKIAKAASELGKKGGEAAAKAREKAEKEEPEPKVEAKAEKEPDEEGKPGNPRHDARARVMEATRKLAEERRLRQDLEHRLAQIEARLPREEKAKPAETRDPEAKPRPEQFELYEDYVEALTDWKFQARAREGEQKARGQQHAQQLLKKVETFNERVSKAAAADPDLMTRIDDNLLNMRPTFTLAPNQPPTAENDIAQVIVESEHAAALLVHLSEHPDDMRRLRSLPDSYAVARAIGALEAKLEAGAPATNVIAEAVSKAKPPVRPVSGSAQVSDDDLDPDNTGFDEWVRVQNARDSRARRGR